LTTSYKVRTPDWKLQKGATEKNEEYLLLGPLLWRAAVGCTRHLVLLHLHAGDPTVQSGRE